MTAKNLLGALLLAVAGLAGSAITSTPAWAQTTTTGAIQGVVKDAATGEPLIGVAVVASSNALQGTQSGVTDENGAYKITNLPPGEYLVTFYYAEVTVNRSGVNVGVQKVTPVYQSISTDAAGETIKVIDSAPTIDPTSTSHGITLDQEYTKNIPVPGRTFDAALGAAAGSQGDAMGVAFSGSTSLENQYFVDGVNTTGLKFGTVGNPVINDFIEEIEVITGGYNAEYGRATGGVVNVVTKSGSNEIEGSVFGTFTSDALVANYEETPVQSSAIDFTSNLSYEADIGFDLGGPILKDKVWFYVGFAPQFAARDYTRIVKRRTDCRQLLDTGELSECRVEDLSQGGYADARPDTDPDTGFFITDEVHRRTVTASSKFYNAIGKINFAVSPEHQGQVSFVGGFGGNESPGIYGIVDKIGRDTSGLTSDASLKWTSKFNDNKTEVEGVLGWHRSTIKSNSIHDELNNEAFQALVFGNLGQWGKLQGYNNSPAEDPIVWDDRFGRCHDNVADVGVPGAMRVDPYPNITNCPDEGVGYVIGGPGSLLDDKEERFSGKLSVTQRVKAIGSHEIKAGADVENNTSVAARRYSGGQYVINYVGNSQIDIFRWAAIARPNETRPWFDNLCADPLLEDPRQCDWYEANDDQMPGAPGTKGSFVTGNTLNWSTYLRDSWQIRPNLTFNVGMRYEEQRLRVSDELQNTVDPLTGEQLGKNAMVLKGMFAPRVGLLYDWTKEGRSKIYGSFGRYYESIPMDINERAFGGEVFYQQRYAAVDSQNPERSCGLGDPNIGGPDGTLCPEQTNSEDLLQGSGVLVAPGIKAQYLDEKIFGVQYEIMEDLNLGIAYQNRSLGRVIEDVSTDGAATYIIANPGEWSQEDQDNLQARIDAEQDPAERARLEDQMVKFKDIRVFDKPRRDYNALQFTLTRRFSKSLYMQGSYTFSRSQGNYPGLFSADNGQVDPNISSQYDLVELLANRDGPLPQDRPHYIKIDGYYIFDFKKAGELTLGARFRALSGVPIDVLGPHFRYGGDEAFILPRGELGRTDFEHSLDLHVGYGYELGRGMELEVFADLFNVYNRQGEASVDETYAYNLSDNNVNPIVGGTYEDLIFAKALDDTGKEPATPTPLLRNPNFGNTAGRYAPFQARFGARLTF